MQRNDVRRSSSVPASDPRRGSTLLIVLALMGLLAVLGFLFYTFAAQENASATSFSNESRVLIAPGLEQDDLFDIALQQLILGPEESRVHSALWGGRHSLAANMLGTDGIPFNGEGVHLMNSGGEPGVDLNYNNVLDDGGGDPDRLALREPNDSPAANNGNLWLNSGGKLPGNIPQPDTDYTYPDINHMFLAHKSQPIDSFGNLVVDGSDKPVYAFIPSFHRPQYLRTGGNYDGTWKNSNSNNFPRRSLRPHPSHAALDISSLPTTSSGLSGLSVPTSVPVMNYSGNPVYRYTSDFPFNGPVVGTTTQNIQEGLWEQANPPSPIPNASIANYNYDLDLDGDGRREAILLDLDVPAQRRGDGTLVYPMYAFTIYDANGLINLNATGNLAGLLDQYRTLNGDVLNLGSHELGSRKVGPTAWVSDSVSKSNQGLSTWEINPTLAMTADPTSGAVPSPQSSSSAADVRRMLVPFGYTDSTKVATSRSELANLEWLMLLSGRPRFHPQLAQSASTYTDLANAANVLVAGRNGDIQQIPQFLLSPSTPPISPFVLPGPGLRGMWTSTYPISATNPAADDNFNRDSGDGYYSAGTDRFVWPLDNSGRGRWHQRTGWGADKQPGVASIDDDGNGVVDDFGEEGWQGSDDGGIVYTPRVATYNTGAANNDLRWPSFLGYSRTPNTVPRWGDSAVTTTYAAKLVQASGADPLVDDPAESVFDPEILSSTHSQNGAFASIIQNDSVFGPEEAAFLQTGQLDLKNSANRKSRLAELAPMNFVEATGASEIRQRFTTISTDRRELSWATPNKASVNLWETTSGFPPIPASGNPFRGDLYQLLTNQPAAGFPAQRLKLDVNRLVTNNGAQYQFRRLIPFASGTSVTDPANVQAIADRTSMARDIYTLLYTFCSTTTQPYYGGSAVARPTGECQAMAQFAVNLVDALDTDDVITEFQYDTDLSDGMWNPTAPVSPPGAPVPTVFGVERQLLTFSEAMAFVVQQTSTMNDSDATIFDDAATPATGRRYAFLELQNIAPYRAIVASTAASTYDKAEWRVLSVKPASSGTGDTALKALYLLNGLSNTANGVTTDSNGNQTLSSGSIFTISSQDGSDTFQSASSSYHTSDFRVDYDLNSTFDRIVPLQKWDGTIADNGAGTPTTGTMPSNFPTPFCNLDLCYDYSGAWGVPTGGGRFALATPTVATDLTSDSVTPITGPSFPGAFVQDIMASASVKFVLQRRATGNHWATVDSITLSTTEVQTLTPPDPATMATIPPALLTSNVSLGRSKPLNRNSTTSSSSGDPNRPNTLGRPNVSGNDLWQWHPDRDFASLGEILLVPVDGPDQLTNGRISNDDVAMNATRSDTSTGVTITDPSSADSNAYQVDTALNAGGFMRNPSLPQVQGGSATANVFNGGNRWYRLLQFLEVLPRDHRYGALATGASSTALHSNAFEPSKYPLDYGWPKKHGALNLNTIRHAPVWAALIDDDLAMPNSRANSPNYWDGLEQSSTLSAPLRGDWWQQFLVSRDGSSSTPAPDPVTGYYVPGTISSRPFRDWSFARPVATQGVEDTILRSLPADAISGNPPIKNRHLMELGTNADHLIANQQVAGTNLIPPAARHRLLSKILNNTTTRSNTFFVFVGVQFHEAFELDVGSGKRALQIGRKLDEMPVHRGFFVVDRSPLVDQVRTVKSLPGGTVPSSGSSYRYLQDTNNGSNPNGLRWRDTILYRQILN